MTDQQAPPLEVIVRVTDGMHDVDAPRGVRVRIYDYDTDGTPGDELQPDDKGELCYVHEWFMGETPPTPPPTIYELWQQIMAHPDYAGGTLYTRADVAEAAWRYEHRDDEEPPDDYEELDASEREQREASVTAAELESYADIIQNLIYGDYAYSAQDAYDDVMSMRESVRKSL